MKVYFDTTPFEFAHGKAPKGLGSWAFVTKRNADVANAEECWFSPSMTYAEAKRWALGEVARRFGKDAEGTLYVLS